MFRDENSRSTLIHRSYCTVCMYRSWTVTRNVRKKWTEKRYGNALTYKIYNNSRQGSWNEERGRHHEKNESLKRKNQRKSCNFIKIKSRDVSPVFYMFNKLITMTPPFTLCVSQQKNSVNEKLCSVSQLRFHPSDTPIFLCGQKKIIKIFGRMYSMYSFTVFNKVFVFILLN